MSVMWYGLLKVEMTTLPRSENFHTSCLGGESTPDSAVEESHKWELFEEW